MVKETYHKIVFTEGEKRQQVADELLNDWWWYTNVYQSTKGYGTVAPYCSNAPADHSHDDASEVSEDKLNSIRMASIEFCVSQLATGFAVAIGIEMKNRQAGAKVWRPRDVALNTGVAVSTYSEALVVVAEIMRKEGLL